MKVGNTPTGESINLDGSPFDMAEIIIPEISFVYNITNDLASGSSLTMQRASNKSTAIIDWNGNYHNENSNRRDGTGTMTVLKDSYSEKLLLYIFNMLDDNKAKISFDVHYWNAADTDIQAEAINCTLQNVAPVKLSNGSTNDADAEQWSFNAQIVKRESDNPSDDVIDQIKSAEAQKTSAYSPEIMSEEISADDSSLNAELPSSASYSPEEMSEKISADDSSLNAKISSSASYSPEKMSEEISADDSSLNAKISSSASYTPNYTDGIPYLNQGEDLSQEQSWTKDWISSASQKLSSNPEDSALSEEIDDAKKWTSLTAKYTPTKSKGSN